MARTRSSVKHALLFFIAAYFATIMMAITVASLQESNQKQQHLHNRHNKRPRQRPDAIEFKKMPLFGPDHDSAPTSRRFRGQKPPQTPADFGLPFKTKNRSPRQASAQMAWAPMARAAPLQQAAPPAQKPAPAPFGMDQAPYATDPTVAWTASTRTSRPTSGWQWAISSGPSGQDEPYHPWVATTPRPYGQHGNFPQRPVTTQSPYGQDGGFQRSQQHYRPAPYRARPPLFRHEAPSLVPHPFADSPPSPPARAAAAPSRMAAPLPAKAKAAPSHYAIAGASMKAAPLSYDQSSDGDLTPDNGTYANDGYTTGGPPQYGDGSNLGGYGYGGSGGSSGDDGNLMRAGMATYQFSGQGQVEFYQPNGGQPLTWPQNPFGFVNGASRRRK